MELPPPSRSSTRASSVRRNRGSERAVIEPEARIATVSAAVLAGGASSRMGQDKARAEFAGVACTTRAARLLSQLFEEVMIVGGDPPADAPGRRVSDPEGTQCSLRGLVGALQAARTERVIVVATDLPLLTPELLLALFAWPDADAVVPRTSGGVHPLCALYRRTPMLDVARARFGCREFKLEGLLASVDTQYLEGADLEAVDPDGTALTNINTPEDLRRAEASLSSSSGRFQDRSEA